MKKVYLLGLLAAGFVVNAQTQKQLPASINQPSQAIRTNRDFTPPSPVINRQPANTIGTSGKGLGKNSRWVVVGQTEFDRPTNASTYRRIIVYPDGKKSVIWTTSVDGPSASYTLRGTGYNHFNGSAWGEVSKSRIESERTGYPSFDYDPVNGTEVILSHKAASNGISGGMILSTNGGIGSTTWTGTSVLGTLPTSIPGVLWPRTAISGNKMIVIASYTDSTATTQPGRMIKDGIRTPQVYSRYDLTTKTWDVENALLPGYDSTRYYQGGGDNYAIDAKGNNVAILMGGMCEDIALWKSSDNGVNWTKTIIDSFPIPAYDFKTLLPDTPFTTDGALSVKLDDAGNAHCFWAISRVLENDLSNTTFSFFSGWNTIRYWYEGRPDSIVPVGFGPESSTDDNETYTIGQLDERTRYGNLSLTTAPYAVNSGDTIYMAYQARTDEDVDGQGFAFTDIYLRASKDNGATWADPLNLTAAIGLSSEQTFASAAADCRSSLHLTFMHANSQGFYEATDNPSKTGPFDIVYYEIPVTDIFARNTTGVNEANDLFSVNQNFPNPFSGSTTIPVKLNRASDVKISIVNLVGQTIYTNTFENNPAGVNQFELNIDAKPGLYFYSVEAGDFKETKRMIIK